MSGSGSPKMTFSSSELLNMIKQGGSNKSSSTPSAGSVVSSSGISINYTSNNNVEVIKECDPHSLLGLASTIRCAHSDPKSFSLGIDGESSLNGKLSFNSSTTSSSKTEFLSLTMNSPWSFGQENVNDLNNVLPSCYNVQESPHASSKIRSFTEETLFYIFYGMPRDRLQELAAAELTLKRNWRFHKDLRLWFLPSSALLPGAKLGPSQATAGISTIRMSPAPISQRRVEYPTLTTGASFFQGYSQLFSSQSDNNFSSFIIFDPNVWGKVRRDIKVPTEAEIEDRFFKDHDSAIPLGMEKLSIRSN